MTVSTKIMEEQTKASPIGHQSADQHLQLIINSMVPQFDKLIQTYVLFNILFFILGVIEFALLISFFTFLAKSAILAFSLALVFLTFFSYFIFRLYLQTKKPEQFEKFTLCYLTACKGVLGYKEGTTEHLITLANACIKLADTLEGKECGLYQPPNWLDFLRPHLEKFSYWCHWQDVLQMKELLLHTAIEENIKFIKYEPISIKAHATLARTYLILSSQYTLSENEHHSWTPSEQMASLLEQKSRVALNRALEEFTIIREFDPDQHWVYAQMAYCYHNLGMPMEEIHKYETMLSLNPEDADMLTHLGELYFQQGFHAKGLHIYAKLIEIDRKKAEKLMKSYG